MLKSSKLALASFLVSGFVSSLTALAGCGGGSDGGGGSPPACTDVAGEPDILGQIAFEPGTASPGDLVQLKIPVDAEVEFLTVNLSFDKDVNIGGVSSPATYAVATPGVQTLSVPIQTNPAAGADSYTPTIQLCTHDTGTCESSPGAGGVGVSYFMGIPGKDGVRDLTRARYFTNGGPENVAGSTSCVVEPELILR